MRIDRAGPGNSLTGCKFVNNPFVYYNVISANHRNGLYVPARTLTGRQFSGIGANNATPLGNRGDGILIGGSSANTQVGAHPGELGDQQLHRPGPVRPPTAEHRGAGSEPGP